MNKNQHRKIFLESGCIEDTEYDNLWKHPDLPFDLMDEEGYLKIMVNIEYIVSRSKLPTTKQSIENLIKVFNP